MTPQLIISLSPNGELVCELPGLNGSRRKINLQANQKSDMAIANATQVLRDISQIESDPDALRDATKAKGILDQLTAKIQAATDAANSISSLLGEDNTICDILLRILHAQLKNNVQIGEDGAPTAQQVRHWQKHSGIWGDPTCPFCIAEGKFEKGKNREKSLKGLTEQEALRCGLISRSYIQNKKDPNLWKKFNNPKLYLLPNGKILGKDKIQWSKRAIEDLIIDGKAYAKKFGFTPVDTKPKTIGSGVKVRTIHKLVRETKDEKLQDQFRF